jgi:hypothetical protein
MNGAIMKNTFLRIPILALLLVTCGAVVRAQDSRIQMTSLDHLAARASQTVDVNIDERMIRITAKIFDEKDPDEKKVKEIITGLKGIYVKNFEFESEGQYSAADIETVRAQLRGPGWTRFMNFTSKKEGTLEIYLMMPGEQISGLAVLHTDHKQLTVVNIVGPVDLDKLTKLEGQLGVPDLGIEPAKTKTKN